VAALADGHPEDKASLKHEADDAHLRYENVLQAFMLRLNVHGRRTLESIELAASATRSLDDD